MRAYTGLDDPKEFPGEHVSPDGFRVYIDKVTINDVLVPGEDGKERPLFTDNQIAGLKEKIMRQYGNLNLFYQEYECEFTTVNAGLVYQGIERLTAENRYVDFNIDTAKPVYMA